MRRRSLLLFAHQEVKRAINHDQKHQYATPNARYAVHPKEQAHPRFLCKSNYRKQLPRCIQKIFMAKLHKEVEMSRPPASQASIKPGRSLGAR